MVMYKRLTILFILTLMATAFYFLWENLSLIPFIVELRLKTIFAIILSGTALGVATLLFHAVANNRIVTPSSLGLEFLYVLVKTAVVFVLGSAFLLQVNTVIQFISGCLILVGFALLLYRFFLKDGHNSIFFLLLVGMIASSLFMTLNSFFGILMDPTEFQIAQDIGFASFNRVETTVLKIAAVIIIPLTIYAILLSKKLDVLVLGKDCAINLGIDYHKLCQTALIITVILIAASTMLAGPMFFFGLLILNLVLQFIKTFRHQILFPAIIGMSILILMLGQNIVFHLLNFKTELSVIINFIGGVYFFYLILKVNQKWQLQ
ncbi:MAG: iron chelate uptake ABC transporter family permease subunit [Neisseriaceae bacterium]|nr:iron chelate uptake ABC transporter family permease subunit [Neisseriaceae bacterium]